MTDLFFSIETNRRCSPIYDPSDYTRRDVVNVLVIDEKDREEIGGKVIVKFTNLSMSVNDGESAVDVFDSFDQELSDFYCAVTQNPASDDFYVKDSIENKLGYEINLGDVLYIEYINILPKFRRQGLGAAVIRCLYEQMYPSASLVALKPVPLQFAKIYDKLDLVDENDAFVKQIDFTDLVQDRDKAQKKLERYYKSIGFHKFRNIPYLIRAANY